MSARSAGSRASRYSCSAMSPTLKRSLALSCSTQVGMLSSLTWIVTSTICGWMVSDSSNKIAVFDVPKSSPTVYLILCFFFQAEDGIRDLYVTGVQTCALPISRAVRASRRVDHAADHGGAGPARVAAGRADAATSGDRRAAPRGGGDVPGPGTDHDRSEERRVGKECRSRWSPEH